MHEGLPPHKFRIICFRRVCCIEFIKTRDGWSAVLPHAAYDRPLLLPHAGFCVANCRGCSFTHRALSTKGQNLNNGAYTQPKNLAWNLPSCSIALEDINAPSCQGFCNKRTCGVIPLTNYSRRCHYKLLQYKLHKLSDCHVKAAGLQGRSS